MEWKSKMGRGAGHDMASNLTETGGFAETRQMRGTCWAQQAMGIRATETARQRLERERATSVSGVPPMAVGAPRNRPSAQSKAPISM